MQTPAVIAAPEDMQAQSRSWHRQGLSVGLVPTMGYLHAGHLALVEASVQRCARTVVSIFVNPLQFGPQEDFAVYPRDLERDLGLLAPLKVDAVFHPAAAAFYPADHATAVEVSGLTAGLCGRFRPGHFRGVTTVVAKLFNVAQPDIAVFGQKDYQQLAVIRRMVRDLNMGIQVLSVPTVREADGLAMSSRNTRLSADERRRAPAIYRLLRAAADSIAAGQQTQPDAVRQTIAAGLAAQLSPDIDYVEVVDPESLQPVERISGPVVIAVAVRLPSARLIDNVRAEPPG